MHYASRLTTTACVFRFDLLAAPLQRLHLRAGLFPGEDARRDFVYLPSIATLRWLRAPANTARHTMRLAVVADPVFRIDAAPERGGGTREAAEIDIRSLARLPNSRREAQSIAALLPKEQSWLAMDYAASRDTVLTTDWRQFSIVHFAAHSIVDLRQPELSGIVLSLYNKDGKSQDGFLRINDIYNLDMPADLVVLSACESGIGKTLRSEGSFSLARAFFYAGAPRVIASLWAVDDRATAKFMVLFYRALLVQGKSASAALRAAQQALARDPRWHAAYYWAGVVLQGDWR